MIRSRAARVVAVLAASLAMALVVVVATPSHEADLDDEVAPADGPAPTEGRPVPMPRGLIALEISLGLNDPGPREWEGEVRVSEGRVVALEVVRSGAAAKV